MRVVAFILARAGSKGLPGKNIALLGGKPLIVWSIDAARACDQITTIFVSTDGQDIASVGERFGASVLQRPDALSNDTAMPKDAILYHLDQLSEPEPEIIVLLQPTSPFRSADDISACVEPVMSGEFDSAATFVKSPSSPFRAWRNTDTGPEPFVEGFDPWLPRQSLPPTYALNGAVYAVRTDVFRADPSHSFLPGKARLVEMPAERSIDIDTQLDLTIAEALLNDPSILKKP